MMGLFVPVSQGDGGDAEASQRGVSRAAGICKLGGGGGGWGGGGGEGHAGGFLFSTSWSECHAVSDFTVGLILASARTSPGPSGKPRRRMAQTFSYSACIPELVGKLGLVDMAIWPSGAKSSRFRGSGHRQR
jgi:hypothetical protein